jgi:hypothetical protein
MSEISEEPQPTGATVMSAVEEAFEEIDVDEPRVGIIMGSKNDKPKMQPAAPPCTMRTSATRCG